MAPLAIILIATVVNAPARGDESLAGSQGTNTALPLTDSAVTVSGRGEFGNLKITLNQTESLINQAVSITWTGGTPTVGAGVRFGSNFLQIMQCWGDDDGMNPDNPGPPPEQCVMGGLTAGGNSSAFGSSGTVGRVISRSVWENFDPTVGYKDPNSIDVWRPFRSVDGTVINAHINESFNPEIAGSNYWLNPYFDAVTTNEIGGGITGRDGRGAELMQINTGLESSGLGCGQRVQRVQGGGFRTPQCWVVIVPRGAAATENLGATVADAVVTSPLAPAAWQNRIAVPISLLPVDSSCSLGNDERRIAGNELAQRAVSSWQPALCAGGDLPPFSYATVPDATARQQLVSPSAGGPGMTVVSRKVDVSVRDPKNPIVYAPLTLSGVGVGFNLERSPRSDSPAALQLAGIRVAELNLTPRLVAKLLTQSYGLSVSVGNTTPPYEWLGQNPGDLGADPDFLRFNPEFTLLLQSPRPMASLSLPSGSSDAARQVWKWILDDAEAAEWLSGVPDEWGARVNPVYSTNAGLNPFGLAFGTPIPETFPKSDPYCYAPPASGSSPIVPPLLCGTDWMPYTRSFSSAADVLSSGFTGARTTPNPFPRSTSDYWSRDARQGPGGKTQLAITDTASAARLGIQMARLSASGDDGTTREFLPPTQQALIDGLSAVDDQPLVVSRPVVSTSGYPLTSLTYAAVAPLKLDARARIEYSAFIRFAVGEGQKAGVDSGELPAGYAPLPERLVQEANAAAQMVESPDSLRPAIVGPSTSDTLPTTVPAASAEQVPAASPSQVPATSPVQPSQAAPSRPRSPSPSIAAAPPAGPTESSVVPEAEVAESLDALAQSEPTVEPPASSLLPTPVLALARSRYAVPGIGFIALFSALGALEITKRPRRPGVQVLEGGK